MVYSAIGFVESKTSRPMRSICEPTANRIGAKLKVKPNRMQRQRSKESKERINYCKKVKRREEIAINDIIQKTKISRLGITSFGSFQMGFLQTECPVQKEHKKGGGSASTWWWHSGSNPGSVLLWSPCNQIRIRRTRHISNQRHRLRLQSRS